MSLSGHAGTIVLLEFMLVLRLSIYYDAAESSSEFMTAEKLGIGAHSLAKLKLEQILMSGSRIPDPGSWILKPET